MLESVRGETVLREAPHNEVNMNFRATMTSALPALLGAAILGCGSSGPATMNVHLVDGPDSSYKAVTLEVKKLEIHGPNGWQTLADFTTTPDHVMKVNNLLDLRYGLRLTLAANAPVVAGHYDQMRMLLGPNNSVTLADGSTSPLKVPSGMQSGVKFPLSFDIAEGTTRDVFIDIDAHRSIFVHQAGASGQYLLRPVVRAIDKLVGSISGTLNDQGVGGVLGPALGNVEVMAEVVDPVSHQPVVVRSTVTDTNGPYTLDLLPLDLGYYVVAQPGGAMSVLNSTTVYEPAAAAAPAITEASPNATQDLAFAPGAPASVGGAISPVITNTDVYSDAVFVLASFSTAPAPLVVRTVNATVNLIVTPATESYSVSNLPLRTGGYTLAVERSTTNDGGFTTTTWTTDSVTVLDAAANPPVTTRNLSAQ